MQITKRIETKIATMEVEHREEIAAIDNWNQRQRKGMIDAIEPLQELIKILLKHRSGLESEVATLKAVISNQQERCKKAIAH